jgi:predicted regulator of Ras-like GTPase activity (Roadblock/LC7/MglB family)/flagellar biosynthesis chaperone FliJ
MEARDVGMLKYLLDTELSRLKDETDIDLALFMGVDGRIFSSCIPFDLDVGQYYLLTLVHGNLPHVCAQLRQENMKLSIQQYNEGIIVISGVGENAFLACLMSKQKNIADIESKLKPIIKTSAVLKHLFEMRPLKTEELSGYSEDVIEELSKLSRLLFKERFTYTKEYKKNVEILDIIKSKLTSVLGGKGAVNEVVTMTFNEMGMQVGMMKKRDWMTFLEKVINDHITRLSSDIVAEECRRTWVPEIQAKLKSFV